MAHTRPNSRKRKHSIFIEKSRNGVLSLLDYTWEIRGPPERQGGRNGRDVYTVDIKQKIGEDGQTNIKLVMEDDVYVVTAYPVFN